MANYIKLDFDWFADPKVLVFEDSYGKESVVDVIKLFCALGEFYGRIDLREQAQRLHLQQVLGMKGDSLDGFLEQCAQVGLIRKDWYEGFQVVGSDRSVRDGKAREKRKEYAHEASAAAKAKRDQAKREGA